MNKVVNWFGNLLLLSLLVWMGYKLVSHQYLRHHDKTIIS